MKTFLLKIFAPLLALSSIFSPAQPQAVKIPLTNARLEQAIQNTAVLEQRVSNIDTRLLYLEDHPMAPLGASLTIPTPVALFETSLASKITSTATSMTLVSATDKTGTSLASSTYGFILDEGSAQEEMVLADCTGTTCTNMTRGISPLTGTSTVASLEFAHGRGASVKITDGPQLLILSRIVNGTGGFPNKLSYASAPTFTNGTDIIDKTYADALAIAGAPTAQEGLTGIVRLGTQLQMASSTFSAGTPTVLYTNYSTSSPSAVCGLCTPITQNNGKLIQSFLDLSQNWIFTGNLIASSTNNYIASTTIPNVTAGNINATSTIKVNGVNVLTSTTVPQYSLVAQSTVTANNGFATSSLLTIPANTLTASSTITLRGTITCIDGSVTNRVKIVNANGSVFASFPNLPNCASISLTIPFTAIIFMNQNTSSQLTNIDAVGVQIGGTIASSNQTDFGGTGSSSFNLSNAFSVGIQLQSSAASIALQRLSIIVNP